MILAGFFKMSRNNIFKRAIFAKELVQYELIKKIYINNRYMHKCFAGSMLAVMAPGGDIYPCEMTEFPIGNIKDFNFSLKKLWSSKEAKKTRRYIKDVRCFCTYECALTTGIFFNPFLYPSLIKKFMGIYYEKENNPYCFIVAYCFNASCIFISSLRSHIYRSKINLNIIRNGLLHLSNPCDGWHGGMA